MLADLLALVLPAVCAGCGQAGPAWCAACASALAPRVRPVVPSPPPPGFPATCASADYDGVARKALLAHKEHGRRAVRPALSAALAAAIRAVTPAGSGAVVIVPVPSSPSAIRARGGDPVGAMARSATRRVDADSGCRFVLLPALRQVRRLADQAGLDTAGRAANLAGAFGLRPGAAQRLRTLTGRGAVIIIVDDVCTTGATLAEAARALRSTGAGEPLAAVVAATRKRHPPARPPPRFPRSLHPQPAPARLASGEPVANTGQTP